MAVVDKAWDGSASRFPSTEAYCSSCLIDLNEAGKDKTQSNCKLPIREPGGAINKNALGAAAAALAGSRGGVQAPADAKKKAARALIRAYGEAKMDCPPSLKNMAS